MANAVTEEETSFIMNEPQIERAEETQIPITADGSDDTEAWPAPSRERGCLVCLRAQRVTHFDELKPGDHICMPGTTPLLGQLYSHHAIVKAVENVCDDGQTAKLTVIDVDNKGKFTACIPCGRAPYQVNSHKLYDHDIHKLSNRKVCLFTDEVYLEKIDYRKRKFDKGATLKRAIECNRTKNDVAVKYTLFGLNCEDFVANCVNGPNTLSKFYKHSLSRQAFNCIEYVSLLVLYFCLLSLLLDMVPVVVGIVVSILITISLILFQLIFFKMIYVCRFCIVTHMLKCVSKFIFTTIIAYIFYVNSHHFEFVMNYYMRDFWAYTLVVFLNIMSALLIALLEYTISSLIAKCILWIGGCCFSRVRGYCDYVPYRGFLCMFNTCCCKEEKVPCCCF